MIRLLPLLLLAGCAPPTAACADGTLFVAVTLDAGAQAADQLRIDVSIDAGTPVRTTLAHTPGRSMGGLQIAFPSGYPKGHSIVVTVTALASAVLLGAGSVTVVLTDRCAAGLLAVTATAAPLDSAVHESDLAAVDLSSSPPGDGGDLAGAGDAASVFDLAPLDLAQRDLARPDLAPSDLAPACVTEDCFNGRDDDCDGLIDCADPDCVGGGAPPAVCVPNPGGFLAGVTLPGAAATCPAAWPSPSPINSDLNYTCTETCSGCNSPNSLCYEYLFSDSDSMCSPSSAWDVEDTCFIGEDVMIPSSHFHSLSGAQWSGNCGPPGGSSSKIPPTWNNSETYCSGGRVGAGCAVGSICVPAGPNHCVLASGSYGSTACPTNYQPRTIRYYSGFDDNLRTCQCACSFLDPGQCSGTSDVIIYDTVGCTGGSQTITAACSGSDISGYHHPVLTTPLTLVHGPTGCAPYVYSTADPSLDEKTVCCTP